MMDKEFPTDSTEARVVAVLRDCFDPEIPVDIFEMGLVYDVEATEDGQVNVTMTLTSPACPVAGTLPPEVEHKISARVPGITGVHVSVVWDPPWSIDMMSEAAKLQLGIM